MGSMSSQPNRSASDSAIHRPQVAGTFYPADAQTLAQQVDQLLAAADARRVTAAAPQALIVPHAGYAYCGPTAAQGYASLFGAGDAIERVLLLGPAHRAAFDGLALPEASAVETPLGTIPIDPAGAATATDFADVRRSDAVHAGEHSLEVQLPWLQRTLGAFSVVPLLIGHSDFASVRDVLEALWSDRRTLVIVSSDLSHFLNDDDARRVDAQTTRAIESLQWQKLHSRRACGYLGIGGLLQLASRRGLRVQTLAASNSGQRSGERSRVVGYGCYAVF